MKKILSISVLVIGFLFSNLGFAVSASVKKQEATSVVFVQVAESAKIIPATKKGEFTLQLKSISPSTSYFSHRPTRQTGTLTTQQFFDNWNQGKNSFAKNNPNATLTYLVKNSSGATQQMKTVPVILNNPKYDTVNNAFTYDIKVLGDSSKVINVASNDYQDVSLFIDASCIWTC